VQNSTKVSQGSGTTLRKEGSILTTYQSSLAAKNLLNRFWILFP
jgi:hypothetical protein